MTNAFEYGDALLPQIPEEEWEKDEDGHPSSPPPLSPNKPYLNLATYVYIISIACIAMLRNRRFRMVVLADEILEAFFETDLTASFRLDPIPELGLPPTSNGLLGELWSTIATDSNKKIFNMFTDEIGKTIGKHQVIHRPSIGRFTRLEEPKARESLLPPQMRHSTSKSSLRASTETGSSSTLAVSPSSSTPTIASQPVMVPAPKSPQPPLTSLPTLDSEAFSMVQAANAALMERATFAIDDSKDDEDDFEDDEDEAGEGDDEVMDEVDAFLEAHDSGLSEADRAVAKGEFSGFLHS